MRTTSKASPGSGLSGSRKQVYAREITGLILIGVLVLILTIIRYWHGISWSAR